MDKTELVIIELDRPRVLKFGHVALKTMMSLTGKDIDAVSAMNDVDLDELDKIMYCALLYDARKNNEVLKLDDVQYLLDEAESEEYIIQKMNEAMIKAFPSGVSEPGNVPTNRQQRRSAGKKATKQA
jgi:hypothetical protein